MLERMARYAQKDLANGGRLSAITRHMLGLYGGQPGAKEYRRFLSEGSRESRVRALTCSGTPAGSRRVRGRPAAWQSDSCA